MRPAINVNRGLLHLEVRSLQVRDDSCERLPQLRVDDIVNQIYLREGHGDEVLDPRASDGFDLVSAPNLLLQGEEELLTGRLQVVSASHHEPYECLWGNG